MTRLTRSTRLSEAPSPIPPPALSLLSAALARGVDGEMLERLIGFNERSQAHEARKAFAVTVAAPTTQTGKLLALGQVILSL